MCNPQGIFDVEGFSQSLRRQSLRERIPRQSLGTREIPRVTGETPVPPEFFTNEVLYSFSDTANGSKSRQHEAKKELALLLWRHLFSKRLCSYPPSPQMRLAKTPLGKPVLTDGESDGPSVSFSRSGNIVWAAASACEAEIGIDAAAAAEFTGDYPLHRMGCSDEFGVVRFAAGGDKAEAAALIWTVKESYVKALGCGFHLFDPLQVRIEGVSREGGVLCFTVSLSEKGREKLVSYCSGDGSRFESASMAKISLGSRLRDHRIGIECAGQMAYATSQKIGDTWLSITTLIRQVL